MLWQPCAICRSCIGHCTVFVFSWITDCSEKWQSVYWEDLNQHQKHQKCRELSLTVRLSSPSGINMHQLSKAHVQHLPPGTNEPKIMVPGPLQAKSSSDSIDSLQRRLEKALSQQTRLKIYQCLRNSWLTTYCMIYGWTHITIHVLTHNSFSTWKWLFAGPRRLHVTTNCYTCTQ